jgi:hypothetical protein
MLYRKTYTHPIKLFKVDLTYDGIIVLSYSLYLCIRILTIVIICIHKPSNPLTESERIELKSFALNINYNIMNSIVVMY